MITYMQNEITNNSFLRRLIFHYHLLLSYAVFLGMFSFFRDVCGIAYKRITFHDFSFRLLHVSIYWLNKWGIEWTSFFLFSLRYRHKTHQNVNWNRENFKFSLIAYGHAWIYAHLKKIKIESCFKIWMRK